MKTKPAFQQEISPAGLRLVESVLALRPEIAVFDCDGTLWDGDAGADFFFWEIERGLIPKRIVDWIVPRYKDYKAGKVDEEAMCGEMVAINGGIAENLLQEAAEEFFAAVVEPRIFPEMLQLTHRLAASGTNLWAVSSTNAWVISAGVRRFGIPAERVLAVTVEVEGGLATDRLIQVPTDEGKALAIRKYVPGAVDACFGNSIHDAAMLEIAKHPFAIGPTAALQDIAKAKGWPVHWPLTADLQ